MSSTSYILLLKAPTPLPSHGVDITTFKVWKNTLLAHIQQDFNQYHFLPGGSYSNWRAAEYSSTRIASIHDEDPDYVAIAAKSDRKSVSSIGNFIDTIEDGMALLESLDKKNGKVKRE